MKVFKFNVSGLLASALFISFIYPANAQAAESEFTRNYRKTKEFSEKIKNSDSAGRRRNDKQLDRWLYLNRLEGPSTNEISRKKETNDNLLSAGGWLPLGPETVPPSYEELSGHSIGRVNCIAFHPSDKNTLWIGTPGGGIWKTINGGKNWMPLCDNAPTPEISDIAVDKNNPDIIYAATGDYDGRGLLSARAKGVMKSTDGGSTWEINDKLVKELESHNLKRVIIHADNSNTLITCGPGGAWKSTNAGQTWENVSKEYLTDLEVDPRNPSIIFAAMSANYNYLAGRPGIMKSTDFGDTWKELPTGIDTLNTRVEIAVSPVDPNYIYAITVSGYYPMPDRREGLSAIYLSTDAGATWKQKTNCLKSENILGGYDGSQEDMNGQGRYDLVLFPDDKDKHKIYVGGVNIWCSTDDGVTWELASFFARSFGPSAHADQHAAAYSPLDGKMYWCNDGGVYRTDEILCGSKKWITDWLDWRTKELRPNHPEMKFPTVWENLSDGLMITEFYKIALCKNFPDIVSGGAQDNSCYYKREDDGWLNYVPNRDGMETAVDNDNPDIVYGVSQYGGLCKSTDGCKTVQTGLTDYIWHEAQEWGSWVTPLAMDPQNPNYLFMGFRNLWYSPDGGNNWVSRTAYYDYGDHTTNLNTISVLKIAHSNPKYISFYKAGYEMYLGDEIIEIPYEFCTTSNGGTSWNNSVLLELDIVTAIEYDRANPNKIYIAAKPDSATPNLSVAYTTNGGSSWYWVVRENVPDAISTIVCHGDAKNTIYVGSRYGVYYTNNDMIEWKPLNENLPNALVSDMEIDFNSKRLYAATYGRGIWYRSIGEGGTTDGKQIPISVYPNPSQGEFTLDFSGVESATPIEVKILDVQGRRVYSSSFQPGVPARIATDLPSGIYFIVANVNGTIMSAKIEIEK